MREKIDVLGRESRGVVQGKQMDRLGDGKVVWGRSYKGRKSVGCVQKSLKMKLSEVKWLGGRVG